MHGQDVHHTCSAWVAAYSTRAHGDAAGPGLGYEIDGPLIERNTVGELR